ncbi:hypothetical protein RQP50_09035 [Paenibacillus sp. chi10]|uniref:Uncharacterized protein n=1 Tax=Paenibacillus suaedae TaxID=3077233 RepID=A0AAJ2JY34_9BACL|nr:MULTISPECIES: hypothetical protein [unclassified Paenibacillus]MDT8976388.1 hypothetical protein [Paenibacillus sp. chi10]GAV16109.1 hypothetical protein PBN151_6094 [Paenibacillus sp. NAIST15-1]
MQLKVPAGYAVTYNKFYDIDPMLSEGNDYLIENWGFFTEDLLQIVKLKINNGKWYIPENEDVLLFDLGWYPDSDINGHYHLQLVDGQWNQIKSISSKDRFLIKVALEEWMEEHQKV